MKKLIVGLLVVAAVLAVRPLMKRKAQRMREHCEQMATKCKQMMAQSGPRDEEAGVHEPGERPAERAADQREPAAA